MAHIPAFPVFTRSIRRGRRLPLLVLLAGAACVAGCGKEQPRTDTQIAVRVNEGEISVHQVQSALQRQPRVNGDLPGGAAAQVLEVLIDQELAAQAARAQGVDQEPAFVQALEAARRELLARNFHDRVAAKAEMPTSAEVDRYFDEHPELFAQRRLYILQETALEATPAEQTRVQAIADQAEGVTQLEAQLRGAGFNPRSRQFVQAAEDLPLALLGAMAKLDPGRSLMLPQAGGARIFTVLQSQLAPVDRQAATPLIASFIFKDRQRQAVGRAMTELRTAAKLQYQGNFAKGAPTQAAEGASAASAPPSGP